MTIGLNTPNNRYTKEKKEAIEEAIKKLGIEAQIEMVDSADQVVTDHQTFGFEELIKRAKKYANDAFKNQNIDIGIGIENSLIFIFSANEWYYVICIALQTRDGKGTVSFTPGISVAQWMIQEVQNNNIELDALTARLAGEDDPVIYFSGKTLTRKELMIPPLLLAFSKLGMGK